MTEEETNGDEPNKFYEMTGEIFWFWVFVCLSGAVLGFSMSLGAYIWRWLGPTTKKVTSVVWI